MSEIKLSQIAEVFNGFSFRSKVENDPQGELYVIQMRDIDVQEEMISLEQLVKVSEELVPSKYLLQQGDVLLIAKGNHNKAIVYDLNLPKAVAASAFFVIRPDPTIIDAYFLAWLLNQTPIQQYFDENRVGTSTGNLNIRDIIEIKFQFPKIDIQQKIAKVHYLMKQEKSIAYEIQIKKRTLIESNLKNLVYAR